MPISYKHFLSLILTIISFFSASVFAAEQVRDNTAEDVYITQPNTSDTIHQNLDRRYRFSKKFQSELGFFGGNYIGDEWRNTWDAGARYFLHFNNSVALGASYYYSPIVADNSSGFARSLSTKNTHSIDAEVMLSNDCAFRVSKSIIECDLFLTLGGGTININDKWNMLFVVGGGLIIYTPLPYIAVRFDVNSLMHKTPKPTGDTFNSDLTMNVGISFLFPGKKIKNSERSTQNVTYLASPP